NTGAAGSPPTVTIPGAGANDAAPTGQVFNSAGAGFDITSGGATQPAIFLFASEDGGVSGWNPTVDATHAILAVDQSAQGSDVKGKGNGFVDEFNTSGKLVRRFSHVGALNSPWGLAIAPPSFGKLAGDILVGQFGSGQIAAFTPHGSFKSLLNGSNKKPLAID